MTREGKKRPVFSGRFDKLGRPIKLSVGESERASKESVDLDIDQIDEIGDEYKELVTETIEDSWLKQNDYVCENPVSYEDLMGSYDERISELRSELEELIEDGDPSNLMDFAAELTFSKEYQDIIQSIEIYKKRSQENTDAYSKINKEFNEAIAQGESYSNPGRIFDFCQAALYANEQSVAVKKLSEEYRNLIVQAIKESGDRRDVSDYIHEYNGPIGNMILVGNFDDDIREWLENRQKGMGGSDYGKLFNTKDKYFESNLESVWESKIFPISDEQVAEQEAGKGIASDAASRGTMAEEFIGELYARSHPETQVLHNKATWKSQSGSTQINFDFLTSSKGDGIPDGILEIKTSNDPDKWGEDGEGIEGIPEIYRAQVLSQCYEGGFKKGALSVLINNSELRSYHFEMTPELTAEAESNKELAEEFYRVSQEIKNNDNLRDVEKFLPKEFACLNKTPSRRASSMAAYERNKMQELGLIPKQPSRALKGVPKNALGKTPASAKNRNKIFVDVAKLRGVSPRMVMNEYQKNINDGMEQADALISLYELSVPARDRVFAVDLETAGASVTEGRIIEYGSSTRLVDSEEEIGKTSLLYDIPERRKRYKGTGKEEVHHISVDEISGHKDFLDPENQEKILSEMKEAGLVLAHNKSFEQRFLRGHLKGFAEAEERGEINVTDSVGFVKFTMPDTEDNTLKSFSTGLGVEYDDETAHRAQVDASVTAHAFTRWIKKNRDENI